MSDIEAKEMTLRDHFAGQALAGLLATGEDYKDTTYGAGWPWFAAAAYSVADAMLEARGLEIRNKNK
jgi:hypothetical protein